MTGNITLWFSYEGFVIDTMDENRKQEQLLGGMQYYARDIEIM